MSNVAALLAGAADAGALCQAARAARVPCLVHEVGPGCVEGAQQAGAGGVVALDIASTQRRRVHGHFGQVADESSAGSVAAADTDGGKLLRERAEGTVQG